MRIGDFTTPAANLREAFDQLDLAWHNVSEAWDDPSSRAFEEQYIASLKPQIKMTLDAIHRLADILGQAQRDCEEEREHW